MQKESTELTICKQIISDFELLRNSKNILGMARFGINTEKAFGVSMPVIRSFGKKFKQNHILALELWKTGYHELRILASIIDDPKIVTEKQMEDWVKDFNSWDICDQCCMNLFKKTSFASKKAIEWTFRKEEFVKRAGFALMAALAIGDKKMDDENFLPFLDRIIGESTDERNFVKKAVNWALRQIGKRSKFMNSLSIQCAEKIAIIDSKPARWIATDALRELNNLAVLARIKK